MPLPDLLQWLETATKSGTLRVERNKTRVYQTWVNIIIANVFKAMRLLQKQDAVMSHKYAQSIRRLQKLADGAHLSEMDEVPEAVKRVFVTAPLEGVVAFTARKGVFPSAAPQRILAVAAAQVRRIVQDQQLVTHDTVSQFIAEEEARQDGEARCLRNYREVGRDRCGRALVDVGAPEVKRHGRDLVAEPGHCEQSRHEQGQIVDVAGCQPVWPASPSFRTLRIE